MQHNCVLSAASAMLDKDKQSLRVNYVCRGPENSLERESRRREDRLSVHAVFTLLTPPFDPAMQSPKSFT